MYFFIDFVSVDELILTMLSQLPLLDLRLALLVPDYRLAANIFSRLFFVLGKITTCLRLRVKFFSSVF